MSEVITPDRGPELSDTPPDVETPRAPETAGDRSTQDRSAASRGLILVAVLLIGIPAAIGLYILRSGKTPPPPGSSTGTVFNPTAAADGDADGGLTTSDLLQPGGATSGRIRYEALGETANLANGGIVALGPNLNLQVTVSPYPPTEFATAVDLNLTDGAGAPIEDAVITSDWDMVMVHGPFAADFSHVGAGRYRTDEFDFFMYGPWQLDISIATPADEASLKLAIFVWPE